MVIFYYRELGQVGEHVISVAICDDEETMVSLEKEKLLSISDDSELKIKTFTNGEVLLKKVQQEDFDIICLDIEMPNLNGMELAKRIRELGRESLLIFITNYENKVFQSLYYAPFRFIRKQYLEEELEEAYLSAKEQILQSRMVYTFEDKKIMRNISIKDILYLEVKGHWIFINTAEKQYKIRETMKEMEEQFGQYNFLRPHVSFLVNPEWVYLVGDKELLLENKISIPLSRSKKEEVKQQLAEYIDRKSVV